MGYEKNLNGEYLRVYNEVIDELQVEEISIDLTKEIENDVLDMFLCAQHDGASPKAIVGESPREFILEIIRDFSKAKSGVFRIGQFMAHALLGLGILSFMDIRNGKLDFTVDILVCLALILGSELLGRVFSRKYNVKNTRSKSKNSIKRRVFLGGLIIGVGITTALDLPVLFVINKPYLFVGGCLVSSLLVNIVADSQLK